MTKKLLSVMMAATMLFATSCQQDEVLAPNNGEEALVQVNLSTPQIATRAYSDGQTATHLQYAVYDEAGNELTALTVTDETINLKKTVNFKLTNGNKYTLVFWAAAPNAPYAIDFGAKTMTVDYTAVVGNDENRDAFINDTTIIVNGNANLDIHLRRPFAQLNIGTSDLEASKNAGYEVTATKISVPVYTTLDIISGEVDGETTFTYDWAALPQGEKFPVDGYDYLAMNYLLVDADKEIRDVKFEYTNGSVNKERTFGSIPVQRNFRTNIYGDLFTNDLLVNVEIIPVYDEPANDVIVNADGSIVMTVANADDLQDAINRAVGNTTIRFSADIPAVTRATGAVEISIVQKEGVNLTIDGAKHKFDGVFTVNGDARANGEETLTFTNINFETEGQDFTFISAPSKVNGRYNYSHNVTIDGCNFKGNHTVGSASLTGTYNFVMKNCKATNMHSLLQTQSCDNNVLVESVATIGCKNGVSFGNTAYPVLRKSTIVADGYGVRADGNASRGDLVIDGVTIKAAQPVIVRKVTTSTYNVTLKGNNELTTDKEYQVIFTNGDDDAAYVAPTGAYKFIGDPDIKVFPALEVADNNDDLSAAVKEGGVVYVGAGEFKMPGGFGADVTLVCDEGTVFTGTSSLNINGATVVGATFSNPSGAVVSQKINGIFKGCTFDGYNALRYTYAGETVVFEDCVISGSLYGVHFDGGANDVIFRNCEISGFNGLGAELTMVTFENCTFKGNGKSGYNGANLWGSAKLVNCNFVFDGTTSNEWIDCIGADKTYEFVNCKVNGVDYTEINYQDYAGTIFSRSHTAVTINGKTCQL